MSKHKIPLTPIEEEGLRTHGLPVCTPSQLSDAFRDGIAWANRRAPCTASGETAGHVPSEAQKTWPERIYLIETGGSESDHSVDVGYGKYQAVADSPLIAAMRAFVASQFGDTVQE